MPAAQQLRSTLAAFALVTLPWTGAAQTGPAASATTTVQSPPPAGTAQPQPPAASSGDPVDSLGGQDDPQAYLNHARQTADAAPTTGVAADAALRLTTLRRDLVQLQSAYAAEFGARGSNGSAAPEGTIGTAGVAGAAVATGTSGTGMPSPAVSGSLSPSSGQPITPPVTGSSVGTVGESTRPDWHERYAIVASDLQVLIGGLKPATETPDGATASVVPGMALPPAVQSALQQVRTDLDRFYAAAVGESAVAGTGARPGGPNVPQSGASAAPAVDTNATYLSGHITDLLNQILASGTGDKVSVDRAKLEQLRAEIEQLRAMNKRP